MKIVQFNPEKKEQLKEIKKNSLKQIYADKDCKNLINALEIPEEIVESNISKFLKIIEEQNTCQNCQGLATCSKKIKGVNLSLEYDKEMENLQQIIVPCKNAQKKNMFEKYYVKRSFDDSYFDYELKDLINDDFYQARVETILEFKKILKKDTTCGVYLCGNTIVGKTFMMAVFSKILAEKNFGNIAFIETPSQFEQIKDMFYVNKLEANNMINELILADILVLDDFGNEYKTEFVRDSILFPLLSARLKANKLTFFTSNYTVDEIGSMYGFKEFNSPKAKQLKNMIHTLAKFIYIDSLPYRK